MHKIHSWHPRVSISSALAVLFVSLGLLFLSQAKAALLVYEGFEYSSSVTSDAPDNDADGKPDLNGLHGGTGFSADWAEKLFPSMPANSTPPDYDYIGVGGLVYGALLTHGNSLHSIQSHNAQSEDLRRITPLPGSAGQTIWLSFLMRQNFVEAMPSASATLTLFSNFANPEGFVQIGILDGNPGTFGLAVGEGTDTSGEPDISSNNQNTAFLVTSITFGDDHSEIELFVNPTPGQPPPLTPSFSISTDLPLTHLDALQFNMKGAGARTWDFDELRIGNTYDDVTPTPEPTGAALLSLGTLLLAARRRR